MAGRPRIPILSQSIIVDAALKVANRTGDVQMTLIANELRVATSSLYNHVGDRAHVIELLRDRLLDGSDPAGWIVEGEWDDVLRHLIRSLRDHFSAYPKLASVFFGQAVASLTALTFYEHLAGALMRGGFRASDVVPIISVVDSYAIGAALDVTVPDPLWLLPDSKSPDLVPKLRASLNVDQSEHESRADRAFAVGLEILVAGLRSMRARAHDEDLVVTAPV